MTTPIDVSTLKDKNTLIIGGASGIGLAIATRFAQSSAYVTIADIQKESGMRIAANLVSEGYKVGFTYCNVTDFDSIVAAFKDAAAFSPSKSLDVVALVAGVIGEQEGLVDQVIRSRTRTEDTYWIEPTKPRHPAIDVNLLGIYDCAYVALHYMASNSESAGSVREGAHPHSTKSLILVSSTAAYIDSPFADYQVSKFGVRGFFRSLRHSTPRLNIRLNAIAPHFIRTALVGSIVSTLAAGEPGQNMTFVDIARVVDAAERLALDESLNGRTLGVLPEPHGIVDLEDDDEGWWSGKVLKGLVDAMRAEGSWGGQVVSQLTKRQALAETSIES
ncbi:MAG: hypothetical protein MMC33_010459 [Icmadophila ericetorum]|nr:hypothetical protein [Icmadophila ericetorum]